MIDKFKVYFLAIDPEKGVVTRYLHRRGCYGVMRLQRAVMEPREVIDQWGADESRRLLEQFRLTGEVK